MLIRGRRTFMTRALLSIGAALALAVAALPTSASAQRGHGGGGVSAGGFARGGGGAPNIGARGGAGSWSGGHRRHVRRGAIALVFAAPYDYDDATPYYADDDCYQLQQV